MVYNNLISRVVISLIFILLYIIIYFINIKYIYYFILIIYLLIIIEVFLSFKKDVFLILIYILISFIFFINTKIDEKSIIEFNLMVLIIVSFDIFSYLLGKKFGKINFLKKISPNKTLEGFIGGYTVSFVIALLYSLYFKINLNYYQLLFIFLIILSSFFGDIVESFFKRRNLIKNSSNFLPGHRGFFDRFDSFILSIIVYSILVN